MRLSPLGFIILAVSLCGCLTRMVYVDTETTDEVSTTIITDGGNDGTTDDGTTGNPHGTGNTDITTSSGTTDITTGNTYDATTSGAYCGDSELDPNEECDDGKNGDNTDQCDDDCKKTYCGDGIPQPNYGKGNGDGQYEQCDDGNDIDKDGCTHCSRDCGNGELDPGEECDDGNIQSGDTCNSKCTRTAYMVFVTSVRYKGSIGGADAADAICNALAQNNLPGVYKAWLSDNEEGPAQRLDHSLVPYIRPDLEPIANSWQALTTANLQNPINRTEKKLQVSSGSCGVGDGYVWTNVSQNGSVNSPEDCIYWTSNGSEVLGSAGRVDNLDHGWTAFNVCEFKCDLLAHLYCFEQPST